MSGKNLPGFYGNNIAQNAVRRYLQTGKTEGQRVEDHRISTANVLSLCIQVALNDAFRFGPDRLERLTEEVGRWSDRFTTEKNILGSYKAQQKLQKELADIMPEPFLLPVICAPKNRREWILQAEKRDAAQTIMLLYAKAVHKLFGFGAGRVKIMVQQTEKVYRQFGDYAADGDYYGCKMLADRMGQILHTDVSVEEEKNAEPIFGDSLT